MENCILKLYFLALDLENIAGEGDIWTTLLSHGNPAPDKPKNMEGKGKPKQ